MQYLTDELTNTLGKKAYMKPINPLNSQEVDGNSMAWLADRIREEGISHEDHYLCCECRTIVKESQWDMNKKLCLECIKENGE